jgi:hypothetical protein
MSISRQTMHIWSYFQILEHRNTPHSYFYRVRKYKQGKKRKIESCSYISFNFLLQKYFFFIIQSAKKYNNNNNNKKILPKRFKPATSWSLSFYSTAALLTLCHYSPLSMIPLVWGSDRHFQYFSAKGRCVRTKKTCLMKLINVSINNKMN